MLRVHTAAGRVNERDVAHTANVLTPDSAALGMVLEQIPLHASQKRISWSYEPVTRMTDMSVLAAVAAEDLEEVCTGMVVETDAVEAERTRTAPKARVT